MRPHISMVTLGVSDLVRATEFYRNGLSLPYSEHSNEHVSFFELSGAWLGLFSWDALAADATVPPQGQGFRGVTIAHNLSSESEVDKMMAEAAEAGAEIIKRADKVFWGGYSGYFRDLDGHLWEVAFNPFMDLTGSAVAAHGKER